MKTLTKEEFDKTGKSFVKYVFSTALNGRSVAKYITDHGEIIIVAEKDGELCGGYIIAQFSSEVDYDAFVDRVVDYDDMFYNKARAVSDLLDALESA